MDRRGRNESKNVSTRAKDNSPRDFTRDPSHLLTKIRVACLEVPRVFSPSYFGYGPAGYVRTEMTILYLFIYLVAQTGNRPWKYTFPRFRSGRTCSRSVMRPLAGYVSPPFRSRVFLARCRALEYLRDASNDVSLYFSCMHRCSEVWRPVSCQRQGKVLKFRRRSRDRAAVGINGT